MNQEGINFLNARYCDKIDRDHVTNSLFMAHANDISDVNEKGREKEKEIKIIKTLNMSQR
jgi:hypothetical protein